MLAEPIEKLVNSLSRLPGVGEKTATRLALHLLNQQKSDVLMLAESIVDVANSVIECIICCNLTAFSTTCPVCEKPGRDKSTICVISSIQDLIAIEKSGIFSGLYHVLHGLLQPLNGVGPNEIRVKELLARLDFDSPILELILATPSSIEGEATALYIKDIVADRNVKISRIASGIPVGGDLQYADRLSLGKAMANRWHY